MKVSPPSPKLYLVLQVLKSARKNTLDFSSESVISSKALSGSQSHCSAVVREGSGVVAAFSCGLSPKFLLLNVSLFSARVQNIYRAMA